jgi:hypothetical protein
MNDGRGLVSGDRYLSGLFMILYQAIRTHLFLIVSATLAVMAIAYFAAQQLPVVYSAQASVRLGRLAGAEIVTAQAAVARMQSQTFKRNILKSMNLPLEGSQSALLIFSSLNARPETPDTLAVSVRGVTEQQARQAIDVAVHLLREEEEASFLGPFLTDLNAQVAAVDTNIASLLNIRESLSSLSGASANDVTAPVPSGGDSVPLALSRVWLLDLASRNEERLATARRDRNALVARSSPSKTYPMALGDDVVTSPVSYQPAKIMIFAGGFTLLGLLFYVMLRRPKIIHTE